MLLTARTFQDLHQCLPHLVVDDPLDPTRRRAAGEIYSVVRLLGALPLSLADFPLQLSKSERPDFALQLGSRSIGIEHTEAVPQNLMQERHARAKMLAREEEQRRAEHADHPSGEMPPPPLAVHFIRTAIVGEARKNGKQVHKEVAEDRMPPPMEGDSVERHWTDAMAHFVEKKVASALKPNYAVHDELWLTIYDSWPAPALRRQQALADLQPRLARIAPFAVFRRVFILTGTILAQFSDDQVLLHRLQRREYP